MELDEVNSSFLESIDTFIFDCDGVLWDEHIQALDGVPDVIEALQKKGKRVYFITNNSALSRRECAERCQGRGYQVDEDSIICTSWLAAAYLSDVLKYEGKTYVVGAPAFTEEFERRGLHCTGPGIEPYATNPGYADYLSVDLDPDVKAVVVGYDHHINYMKVVKASSYLQRPGCHFVATNLDRFVPTNCEIRIPGTGSIVEFVSYAAGRKPEIVGKPERLSKDIIEAAHGKLHDERTLMVGDRLSTDIRFGRECGFKTLFVLSGADKLENMEQMKIGSTDDQKCVPDFYTSSVATLSNFMKLLQ